MSQPTNVQGSGSPTCSIEEFTQTSFDYIVCGGGTAGCVIAARLSENPNITVGVVEAGKYRIGDPLVDIPAALPGMFNNPDYEWCMQTAPQEQNHGKRHHIPRGKLLGGCSAINYMMYARGSLQDYDDWAELVEDEGWSAENMQRYMRKHQTLNVDLSTKEASKSPIVNEFHGTDGPIQTGFNESAPLEIEEAIIKACNEVTVLPHKSVDSWSGDHIGFFHNLGCVSRTGPKRGKRSYSVAYYEGSRSRPNLKVLCDTLVNRVILDGNKATGVNISHDGQEYEVSSRKEVIVCAGAIKSPQILELSGIGDPVVLEAAGVPCKIVNTAIGANAQDHVMTFSLFDANSDVKTLNGFFKDPSVAEAAQKEYFETQGGPLSSIPTTAGFFSVASIMTKEELDSVIQSIRDIKPTSSFHEKQLSQIMKHLQNEKSASLQLVHVAATGSIAGIEDQRLVFPPIPQPGFIIAVGVQYPVARGFVHIDSADPTKQPVIQPNYGAHESDRTILAAGFRWAKRVSESTNLKPFVQRRAFPDASIDLENLKDGEKALHDFIMGSYHICGSVAMGDALDSRLRVKGVEGLRVADASIFPNNISGNIMSSVYALAERAADLIKEDQNSGR